MADLALDASGDILIENDQLSIIDGDDALIQHLTLRLKFVLGEWFLDQRLGVPYFEKVFVKNPNLVAVRSVFREVILETAGIDNLSQFDLSVDATTRKLSLVFTAVKSDGGALDYTREFIIG